MTILSAEKAEMLGKLSGMKFAQGSYSSDQWEEKVNVNPKELAPLIEIKGNKCYWTKEAERLYRSSMTTIAKNWISLGI